MSKKKKNSKKEHSLKPIGTKEEFFVVADSGQGYDHEYVIEVQPVESGVLYKLKYADSNSWLKDLRGMEIFSLLNTGDGYKWIISNESSTFLGYDDFYRQTIFFRFIQNLESRSEDFKVKILKITEFDTFNF